MDQYSETAPPLPLNELTVENQQQLGTYLKLNAADRQRMLGANFEAVMNSVYQMPDTFGVCGVVSVHAAGVMANRETWGSVSYDPERYKEIFDHSVQHNTGKTGSDVFEEEYAHLGIATEETRNIDRPGQLRETLSHLDPHQGMIVALRLHYPEHNGYHTHWLAVSLQNDELICVGDLTPFGITDTSALVIKDESTFEHSVISVLGASATTKFTDSLMIGAQDQLLTSDQKFSENGYVFTFTEQPPVTP